MSIFGPRNVNAGDRTQNLWPLKAYTAFQWGFQEWFIADRPDYSNRLFYDRKRAALGLRSPLPGGFCSTCPGAGSSTNASFH